MNFGVRKLEARGYIVLCYLCDPTFSRFDTIPYCDRHTDTHTQMDNDDGVYVLSIASRGKNLRDDFVTGFRDTMRKTDT